jgi:hypothetical protein
MRIGTPGVHGAVYLVGVDVLAQQVATLQARPWGLRASAAKPAPLKPVRC